MSSLCTAPSKANGNHTWCDEDGTDTFVSTAESHEPHVSFLSSSAKPAGVFYISSYINTLLRMSGASAALMILWCVMAGRVCEAKCHGQEPSHGAYSQIACTVSVSITWFISLVPSLQLLSSLPLTAFFSLFLPVLSLWFPDLPSLFVSSLFCHSFPSPFSCSSAGADGGCGLMVLWCPADGGHATTATPAAVPDNCGSKEVVEFPKGVQKLCKLISC